MKNLVIVFFAALLSISQIQAGVNLALIDAPTLPVLTEQSQLPELEAFPMTKKQVKKHLKNGAEEKVGSTATAYARTVSNWNNSAFTVYADYWTERTEQVTEIYQTWKADLSNYNDDLVTARAVERKAESVVNYLSSIETLIDQDAQTIENEYAAMIADLDRVVVAKGNKVSLAAAKEAIALSQTSIKDLQASIAEQRTAIESDISLAKTQIWEAFQVELYTQLIEDELIHNPIKFQLAVGDGYIDVNGKTISPQDYQKYNALFADYDQSFDTGWQYKVNGNRALHGTADNYTVEVFELGGKDMTVN